MAWEPSWGEPEVTRQVGVHGRHGTNVTVWTGSWGCSESAGTRAAASLSERTSGSQTRTVLWPQLVRHSLPVCTQAPCPAPDSHFMIMRIRIRLGIDCSYWRVDSMISSLLLTDSESHWQGSLRLLKLLVHRRPNLKPGTVAGASMGN
jgi:hypothetical protein